MYPVTTLTASFLALLFIVMSLKIVKLRYQYKVSLGANEHEDLNRLIRGHGNFAEYVPITLLLLLCAEANNANLVVLSVVTAMFVLGRIFHAYAFIFHKMHFKFRLRGMVLTLVSILCLALLDIFLVAGKLVAHA